MSLLLDALRRAERERQRGSAVDLAHLTGMPAPAARGPRRLALGAAVVLAGAGALALGLHLRPERAPAPAPSPTLPVQAVPLAAAPAQALPEPPRAAPVVAVGDVVSLDDVIAAPTEAVPAAPAATVETVPAEAAPAVAQESAVSAAEEPEPPAAEGGEEADVERGEPQPAAPPAPAPRPHGGVPRLRDMPAGYRADFPNLNVDVHVYQRDPQRRFVLINGRRYKEGEQLAEGPLVVQIVENGIVLDYRGERVLYPAAQ